MPNLDVGVMIVFGVIIAIQLSLIITALVLLYKRGCRNLNPTIWAIIIIFVQYIGSIAFLIVGMKQKEKKNVGDEYDD